MAIEDIDIILQAWTASGDSILNPGAAPDRLREAERAIGRELPEEFLALYRRCDGADAMGGNIQLYPLDGQELSVVRASDFLRSNRWPIPPELLIFAGDGQGGSFGLWLAHAGGGLPLVIEVGAIFEGGSFAVTGTSLGRFLLGRTSYFLLLNEASETALDSLALPARFRARRADDLNDEDYDALMRWADPGLPDHPVSPFEARLTADDLRHLATAIGDDNAVAD